MERTLNHISVFGSDSLDELFDLRRRLEIGSIGEAVLNATTRDLQAIRAAMKKLEEFAQKEERTVSEYELLELEFHQALMRASENRILSLINAAIRNYFLVSGASGNGEREELIRKFKDREILEHRMLMHAFELKWPDIAEKCLKRHLLREKYLC